MRVRRLLLRAISTTSVAMLYQEPIAKKTDQTLQAVTTAIETDQWSNPLIQDFKKVKDKLSNCNGVILRGNRIVLPDKKLC